MNRTLRLFSTLCISVLSMTWVHAQERTYSGTVKSSDDGQVIIGANVTVDGTTKGASTGVDGKFTITTTAGQKLVFSYLGMLSQSVTTGNTSTINITLQSDAKAMDEVVVVAFGTSKKKDLTGSISTIGSKLITQQSNSSVSKALEGAVPGVQISSIAGQPGVDATIQVRGLGTAQGSAGALIVIDGVPATGANILSTLNPKDIESMVVSKDAASNSLYGSRGANGVVLITTKKGKAGRTNVSFDTRLGINQQGASDYDIIRDPKGIYEYAWQSIYNSARYKGVSDVATPNMSHDDASMFASKHLFDYDGTTTGNAYNGLGNYMLYKIPDNSYLIDPSTGRLNDQAELLYYDDWRKEFNKTKFRQEYNVNISGATEKTDYYASMGYLKDPSYITGSEFDRYNARMNFNTQVYSWLKAGMNMSFSRRYLRQPAVRWGGFIPGTVSQNIFFWLNGVNQLKPLYARDENGDYRENPDGSRMLDLGTGETYSPYGVTNRLYGGINPKILTEQDKWETVTKDFTGRAYVEATFLKDFKFTANLALDNTSTAETRYNNQIYGEAKPDGRLRKQNSEFMAINTQQLLNWSHDYGQHHVDGLLGHEYYWNGNENLSVDRYKMLVNGMDDFANSIGINSGSGNRSNSALEGFFFRGNYNYNNRYYLSTSVRMDGSSKFKTTENRWGTFWSVGGAWRLSGESFMESARWIDDLKIRASYGTMGNQNGVGQYAGYNLWTLGNSGDIKNPVISVSQGALGNANLSWETVKTIDLGIDFRFWDRFYGTLDYYNRHTVDMIWARPTAPSIGISTLTENTASMRNVGMELDLGVDIIRTQNVLWSFNVNGTHYRNKLTSLPAGVGSPALNGNYEVGKFLRGVGKDFYNLQFAEYAGVDPKTGLGMLYHTVSEADHTAGRWAETQVGERVKTTDPAFATKYEQGTATPDFIGGFSTNLRYKDFDLSIITAFQLGGVYFNEGFVYGDGIGMSDQTIGNGIARVWKNAWTPENTSSNLPMRMLGGTNYGIQQGDALFSDLGFADASYLSIKNITVGYTLPQRLMDRWKIQSVRFYVSLDNMWLFTDQRGCDPRQSLDGGPSSRAYTYPQMRSMSVGLNVNF